MQPNSSEFIELEDFQRLGVRPYECRLTVIRQAAQRSSKVLAERQLKSPSEQVGLQLCRVATSTYRLLDPRQRADSNQRAYVGRILPNTIAHAAPANFHSGAKQSSGENDAFAVSRMSDAQLIEMLEFDAPPIGEGPPEWEVALSDGDLLDPSVFSRIAKRFRQWMWRRRFLIGLALIGAVVGGLIALKTRPDDPAAKWTLDQNSAALTSVDPTSGEREAETPRSLSPELGSPELGSPEVGSPEVGETGTPARPSEHPQPSEPPQPSEQGESRGSDFLDESRAEFGATGVNVDVAPAPDNGSKPMLERIEPIGFPEIGTPSDRPSLDPAMAEPAEIEPAEIEPPMLETTDPAADVTPILEQPNAFEPLSASPELEMADLLPAEQPAVERGDALPFPAPSSASIQETRRRLLQSLPTREQQIRDGELETLIGQLDRFVKSHTVGSSEHFVACLLASEVSWLRDDAQTMEARLTSRLRHYDVDVFSQLASTYRLASQLAANDAQRQHLIESGFVLAERMMLGQKSFDDYESVVSSVMQVAEVIDDEAAIGRVDSILGGLPQVRRLAESAERRMADSRNPDPGVAGRYLCLVLRRWDEGLDKLAGTSNVRLAAVAADEARLGDTANVQETLALAKRWRRCAALAKGREAESMNLHAFDLLTAMLDDVKPIRRIAIENQIEEIRSELPPEAIAARREVVIDPEEMIDLEEPPAEVSIEPAKLGFKGRVLVDGKDVGVAIECRANVGISGELFRQLAARLGRPAESIVVDVSTEFELPARETVIVTSASVNQKIWIGDRFVNQASPAKIELEAGRHTIRWALQAVDGVSAFLRVQAESGTPLKLVYPEMRGELSKPTNWTVQVK